MAVSGLALLRRWGARVAIHSHVCPRSPELARVREATDPHAPPFLRVNNPLANMPAFAKAFGCSASSKMVREKGCEVW